MTMKMLPPLLLMLFLGCFTSTATLNDCNVKHLIVQDALDLKQFAGIWFITMSSVRTPFESAVFSNFTNRNVNYYLQDDGSLLAYPTGLGHLGSLGVCVRDKAYIKATGICIRNNSYVRETELVPAKRFFEFTGLSRLFYPGVLSRSIQVPYWVLATDYQSYSIIYTCYKDMIRCEDGTCAKDETDLLVITRNQTLDQGVCTIALKVALDVCLNEADLKDEIQNFEDGRPLCQPSELGNVWAETNPPGLMLIIAFVFFLSVMLFDFWDEANFSNLVLIIAFVYLLSVMLFDMFMPIG